jgi:hypothetical protein
MKDMKCSECESRGGHEVWCALSDGDSNPSRFDADGRCRSCVYCGDELDMPCDACEREPAVATAPAPACAPPSEEQVTEMVRVIEGALPIACDHPAALHAVLRAEVVARTHRPLGLGSTEDAAYWRALERVRLEVRDGLVVQVRDERPVHRGVVEECFEVLPTALAAVSAASAVLTAYAASVSLRAAREEREAEADLERVEAELAEIEARRVSR